MFRDTPPRRERILYTRHDGGVSAYCPSANCMRWMGLGGRWADRERGYLDVQIEGQIAAGHAAHAAVTFAEAMMFGGRTDAEALEILRDRDCAPFGTAFDLLDISRIPVDRWFRDAWRRSHNGGPIYTNMKVARGIQRKEIGKFAAKYKLELSWDRWKQRIRKAQTPEELKSIWPEIRSR